MTLTQDKSSTPNLASVSLHSLPSEPPQRLKRRLDLLQPIRHWLDRVEIDDAQFARFLSQVIPAQCPFERDIKLFGRLIAHIPPLCKLNPFYDQLVSLRFRALCYLVDRCGEDIQSYIS
ncbi:MAG: Mo-dependent nitrogenase C-terminal domain-containing protein [Kastovskya adunca ATA6-11-RM4]|nr:Mo-dependent nitrogenase C-terminal domain-containing protein [Kastovskya adunca ATA6-11-RM4]